MAGVVVLLDFQHQEGVMGCGMTVYQVAEEYLGSGWSLFLGGRWKIFYRLSRDLYLKQAICKELLNSWLIEPLALLGSGLMVADGWIA